MVSEVQTQEHAVIHCVLHDAEDTVAVVVVEGVTARHDADRLDHGRGPMIELDGAPGHPDRPQGRAQGHGKRATPSSSTASTSARSSRRSRRASTRTSTTSRPSAGKQRIDAMSIVSQDTHLPRLPPRERPRRRAQPRHHPAGRRPVERRRRGGGEQHQGHARDPAPVRAAAVRRRPRAALPHADRHRLATRTSPPSS